MAQMDESRLDSEKNFMNEYWKFRKATGTPEDNDAYWKYVCDYINYLGQKYQSPYFEMILWGCVIDLESRQGDSEQGYKKADLIFLRQLNELRRKKNLPELTYKG